MRFSRFGWPDAAHIGQFETPAAFAASVCLLYTALVVLLSNTRTFSSLSPGLAAKDVFDDAALVGDLRVGHQLLEAPVHGPL